MTKRADRLTAFHVDLAVNLAGSHGVAAGAKFLIEQDVAIELTRRVLLIPAARREASRQVAVEPQAA